MSSDPSSSKKKSIPPVLIILILLLAAAACSPDTPSLSTNDWQWDPILDINAVRNSMRAWTYSSVTGYVPVDAPLIINRQELVMDGQVIFPSPSLPEAQALRAWEGQIWIDFLEGGALRQLHLYDYRVKLSSDLDVNYATQLILKVDTSPINNLGAVDGHSATANGCLLFMAQSFAGYVSIYAPQPGYRLNGLAIALPLPSEAIQGSVSSVAVDAQGTYAVGTAFNGATSAAAYWVDGELAEPPEGATPRAVIETGAGVYLVCADRYYRIDGMRRTDLACPSGRYPLTQSYSTDAALPILAESEGRIYLLGSTVAQEDSSDSRPCYWTDGSRTDLSYYGYDGAWAKFLAAGAGHVVSVGTARSGEAETPVCWVDAAIYPIGLPEDASSHVLDRARVGAEGTAIVEGSIFFQDGSSRRATWVNGVLQD